MKKKNLVLVIIIIAALAGAIAVAAVSPDVEVMRILKGALSPAQLNTLLKHRDAHRAEMRAHQADRPDPVKIWRELALTESQQDRLLDVAGMNADELGLAGLQVQSDAIALRRAVFSGNPGSPAIPAAADQLGLGLADAAVLAAFALEDARSVLTAGQQKTLAAAQAGHDARLREFLDQMPDHVDGLVELWNQLALSPRQMDALREVHRVMPGIMRERHRADREKFRTDLADILTLAQQKVADDFRARAGHPDRAAMRAEREKFEAELALTGSQRIALVNLAISRRDSLENSVLLLAAAGLDLRDQTLIVPVNEAAIRSAAARFAEVLASASSLGAQLVTDAKTILTPKQWALIEKEADRHDLMTARRLAGAPARVHGLIGFVDRLALTPEQKTAIASLIEQRHAERRARFEAAGR